VCFSFIPFIHSIARHFKKPFCILFYFVFFQEKKRGWTTSTGLKEGGSLQTGAGCEKVKSGQGASEIWSNQMPRLLLF
jgi:hypothetical protein